MHWMMNLEDYLRIFDDNGGTDSAYLRAHWQRFRNTKLIFDQRWGKDDGLRVLDVGAHWLHQALLFSLDGYQITAGDFPTTLLLPNVIQLAKAHRIDLLAYDDLSTPTAFSHLQDGCFDVILFGEILEHITFNPVALWSELYRLLAEGGRIVITTPNYYALLARLRELRAWVGKGGGITVDDILMTATHGHHWKEYSRWEIARYFEVLSSDFRINRMLYVEDGLSRYTSIKGRLVAGAIKTIPQLRSRLHVEIDLPRKTHGILIKPHW